MDLISCDYCKVVFDMDKVFFYETVYNHDGDKKCGAFKCPVCEEYVRDEKWESVDEDSGPTDAQMEYFKRGGR